MVCTPWLPPGGSCHDEISASRNRYFVVTDEGWRWLKVSAFHVGWRKPGHIPSIQLHSLTNRSLPLISLATLSSFPPGEAKAASPQRVARLATPTRLKSFWLAAANRIPPIHYSLLSITFAHAGGRCRAGQGTNVSIQAPCGIIRRHCRPAQKLSVYKRVVTGEVQEPTDRYKLRASLSGGTAALVCISFREAWPRLVFFTFTGYNALVTFLKGAFRCKQKKMK